MAIYGLQNGNSGISYAQTGEIPDSIQRQIHYFIPSPGPGMGVDWQHYYGGFAFTGGNPSGIYEGTLGLYAEDRDGIATNPILDNFQSEILTETSTPNGLPSGGAPHFILDSGLLVAAGSGQVIGGDGRRLPRRHERGAGLCGRIRQRHLHDRFHGELEQPLPCGRGARRGDADRLNLPDVFTTADISFERFNGSEGVTLVAHSEGETYQIYLQEEFGAGDAGVEQIAFAGRRDLVQGGSRSGLSRGRSEQQRRYDLRLRRGRRHPERRP